MSMNPFEHKHPHYHDDPAEPLDPGQQSLADALKVSFGVLKVIMLILVVVYLFSGMATVRENEVGVRLMFGRIVGKPGVDQVLEPGLHWNWPYPVSQVVKVDTSVQQLQLNEEFWPSQTAPRGQEIAEVKTGPLDPAKDGSLLTGDANIVQARWTIKYEIDKENVVDFISNVGSMDQAQTLVRRAGERAVIEAVAEIDADSFVLMPDITALGIPRRMQRLLSEMQSGIRVSQVTADRREFPGSVRDAFRLTSQADQERGRVLSEAKQEENKTLSLVAGERAARPLLRLVDEYEAASQANNTDRLKELDEQMDEVFRTLQIETRNGEKVPVTGSVAQIIADARGYATQVQRTAAADADKFEELLRLYKDNRTIVLNRRWQQALQAIWGPDSKVITYWVTGKPYIEIGPDPELRRQMERERLRKERDAARGGGR